MNGTGGSNAKPSAHLVTRNSDTRLDPYRDGESRESRATTLNPLRTSNTADITRSPWSSQIEHVALRNPALALVLFDHVEHGRVSTDHGRLAQRVFNDLIEHEAYDLFATVFTAYNRLHQAHAKTSGAPFCTRLLLQLPEGWAPSPDQQNVMLEAFRRIQVQDLEVVRPPAQGAHRDESCADDGVSDDSDAGEEEESQESTSGLPSADVAGVPVPAAVSTCVVAMLLEERCGVTGLVVNGAMADVQLLADALPRSKLNAIELGDNASGEWNGALTPQELDTYLRLMTGLATCCTLQHLSLGHRDLVCVSPHLEAFDGPALVSVRLVGDDLELANLDGTPQLVKDPLGEPAGAQEAPVVRFMEAIARFETLSRVEISAAVDSVDSLSTAFLRPLQGHKSLTRLEIVCDQDNPGTTDTTDALPTVVEFAADCPQLTHFKWQIGLNFVLKGSRETLQAEDQKWKSRALRVANDLVVMKRRLNDKNLPLKSLKLIGMGLPPEDLQALFDALAEDSRLEVVDVSGGMMNLALLHALPSSLQRNDWLRFINLFTRAKCCYLLGKNQQIHALRESFLGPVTAFEPDLGDDATDQDRAEAQQMLKEMASRAPLGAVFTAPQAQLELNRLRVLRRMAYNELSVDVAALIESSPQAGTAVYHHVAHAIVSRLGDQRALRDVIRLSQVNKATDHRNLHDLTGNTTQPMPEAVKELVKRDSINHVDALGRNTALLAAVRGEADAGPLDPGSDQEPPQG